MSVNTGIQKTLLYDLGGNALIKARDVAAGAGDYLVPMAVVRKDNPASLVGADGDYTLPIVDSLGRLHVRPIYSNDSGDALSNNQARQYYTDVFGYAYNGASWDRLRTVAASGLGLGAAKVGADFLLTTVFNAASYTLWSDNTEDSAAMTLNGAIVAAVHVINSLNVALTGVALLLSLDGGTTYTVGGGGTLAIAGDGLWVWVGSQTSALGNAAGSVGGLGARATHAKLRISTGSAPASGTITAKIFGVTQ